MPQYWEYDDDGEFVSQEYTEGDIAAGTKSTLPAGRYACIDGLLVRTGNAQGPTHYAGSDTIGEGVQGMFSHADGKMYDSRASYYQAVKASGCHIVGDEPPKAPQRATVDWKAAVAETLKQISPTRKGKKHGR